MTSVISDGASVPLYVLVSNRTQYCNIRAAKKRPNKTVTLLRTFWEDRISQAEDYLRRTSRPSLVSMLNIIGCYVSKKMTSCILDISLAAQKMKDFHFKAFYYNNALNIRQTLFEYNLQKLLLSKISRLRERGKRSSHVIIFLIFEMFWNERNRLFLSLKSCSPLESDDIRLGLYFGHW